MQLFSLHICIIQPYIHLYTTVLCLFTTSLAQASFRTWDGDLHGGLMVATKLASQVEKERHGTGMKQEVEASCLFQWNSWIFMKWMSRLLGWDLHMFVFFSPCIWKTYLNTWTRKNHVTRYVLYLALTIGYFDFQSTTDQTAFLREIGVHSANT